MSSGILLGRPENWSFITRFNKAALVSQDSASLRGAIGVLRKSLLLVLAKPHNLVLSWAIVTSNPTHKHTKGKRKREENGKERANKTEGWSGGEENERQMANNVMQGGRLCDGYLVCLDLCEDLPGNGARNCTLAGGWIVTWLGVSHPGNGARNPSCYLLSTALVFPWRGKGDAAK